MGQSDQRSLWIDHIATIGIALSLSVGLLVRSAIAAVMVGALFVVGLLLELRRWWRRTGVH